MLQVRYLADMFCDTDPAWTLEVLRVASPLLEELQMWNAHREHLEAVQAMPLLRRLEVCGAPYGDTNVLRLDTPVMPPRDPPGGLEWLAASDLHRASLLALLRAHGHTLRQLRLWRSHGTPGYMQWPDSWSDLPVLLEQSGLRALERLVLWRCGSPTRDECRQQLAAVRRVLPGTTVQCRECDNLPWESGVLF